MAAYDIMTQEAWASTAMYGPSFLWIFTTSAAEGLTLKSQFLEITQRCIRLVAMTSKLNFDAANYI